MTETPHDPETTPAPRPRRRRGTIGDMFRSLGIVAGFLVVLLAVTFRHEPTHPPVTMDVVAVVQAARSAAQFPVIAADALPAKWYANSAYVDAVPHERGRWHFSIGYTDGEGGYAGVEASDASDARTLLKSFAGASATGQRTIAGLPFDEYPVGDTVVWVHETTGNDAYVITVSTNVGGTERDAILGALRSSGTVAAEATTTS